MRGRLCESCSYAAKKGEPVFSDCRHCTSDRCDKCGKKLEQPFLKKYGEPTS